MKFKYLIIAVCAIMIIILLIAVFLPLVIEGEVSAVNLKYITLPLFGFIVLLLTSISVFLFLNYRLLSLLEREDWPALSCYLEQKIYNKKQYNSRNVRLLASSYLVMSDFMSILKLESKTQLAKPSVINKNVLIFGSARVLSGKHGEAASFFKSFFGKCKGKEKEWVRWFYGFSQLLSGAFDSAESEFSSLALTSGDAIITGLSSYFLHHSIEKYSLKSVECRQISESGRERVLKAIKGINAWNSDVRKMGSDIHVAIIKKYINSAGLWLFNAQEDTSSMTGANKSDESRAIASQLGLQDKHLPKG